MQININDIQVGKKMIVWVRRRTDNLRRQPLTEKHLIITQVSNEVKEISPDEDVYEVRCKAEVHGSKIKDWDLFIRTGKASKVEMLTNPEQTKRLFKYSGIMEVIY